ncbi:hypothetical protein F511_38146 [Dorcoceras hygrometricum]|uniref:DUF632 domain-containing protein n=1 Tax=Dorcoceras hygrometricum TaxID=472368 RepID=A0A2Z7CCP9_9LAMI|nr:hypothetical protein F511_38146 [Dorcoceras hygrometricum]
MGVSSSKDQRSNALKLCKERKRFIKQAIDSRFALAAAHVSYTQSLRNIGIALRRYAEAEGFVESSMSANLPSPSPSHLGGISDSPVLNGSPLSPPAARISYMRSGRAGALTVRVNPPPRNLYVEEGEFSMPPPPPPPDMGSSWDYFEPAEESFRFVGQNGLNLNSDEIGTFGNFGLKYDDSEKNSAILGGSMSSKKSAVKLAANIENPANSDRALSSAHQRVEVEVKDMNDKDIANDFTKNEVENASVELPNLRKNKSATEKDICTEREDPCDFITHRAKDFLSSIKDIDNRFFRASESGKEVSRMLEASKIHVGFAECKGTSSALVSFGGACCQGGATNVSDDQLATKIITWKRTASSRSSSSRNPLATMKDDSDDSGSDFIEEFCMISGSHSSTLDRLYAWERKLYDEVKASESIQNVYDRKCDQLRHQFAKDHRTQAIDKTRAVVKDLHSRIRVALHSVDSISKRIERMRDEELLPQLQELIQGLTKLWKAMLECHHSQYITISLAYHAKSAAVPLGETQRQIISQLQDEVEYFGLSFTNWINSYTSYIEALNSWLQNCILQPRERHKGRRAFSPRRYLAPPIFVLCRDWSAEIKALPSQEVSDAVKAFLSDLQHSVREESHKTEVMTDARDELSESRDEGITEDGQSNTSCIQASLTKVLDRLTKFSEASVKMCEEIRQKCEAARNAYDNYRAPPRSFSI